MTKLPKALSLFVASPSAVIDNPGLPFCDDANFSFRNNPIVFGLRYISDSYDYVTLNSRNKIPKKTHRPSI